MKLSCTRFSRVNNRNATRCFGSSFITVSIGLTGFAIALFSCNFCLTIGFSCTFSLTTGFFACNFSLASVFLFFAPLVLEILAPPSKYYWTSQIISIAISFNAKLTTTLKYSGKQYYYGELHYG